MKKSEVDTTLINGECGFYSFESSHFSSIRSSNNSAYFEKYIIGSGSDEGSGKFNYEYTYSLLHSHDGLVDLGCESVSHKLIPSASSDNRKWDIIHLWSIVVTLRSQIEMVDGSKKEIGTLQVGDNVKSLKVSNLSSQSNDYRTWSSNTILFY